MNRSPAPDKEARDWCMYCHLAALAGFVFPFGSVAGPLIVWLMKKDTIPAVIAHGKAAINFQLTVIVALIVGVIAGLIGTFFCIGWLVFLALIPLGLASPIFAIIAGVKAGSGEAYEYPYAIRFWS